MPIEEARMDSLTNKPNGGKSHKSILDLAPLELGCMNTLWVLGEATVRDIRDHLAIRLPRAYTTIMTIMDRLARKGVVARCKVGRAYLYRPNLSAQQARARALAQLVEGFFGGSAASLAQHLNSDQPMTAPPLPGPPPPASPRPRSFVPPARAESSPAPPPPRMDETLL